MSTNTLPIFKIEAVFTGQAELETLMAFSGLHLVMRSWRSAIIDTYVPWWGKIEFKAFRLEDERILAWKQSLATGNREVYIFANRAAYKAFREIYE